MVDPEAGPSTALADKIASDEPSEEFDAESDANLAALASAEEYLQKNPPKKMLPYQRDMLVDVLQSDCLVVCARFDDFYF